MFGSHYLKLSAESPLPLEFLTKHKVPEYRQREVAECGACCLAMVAAYHGHHLSPMEISALGNGKNGMTLAHLLDAARSLHLMGRGLRVELAALPSLSCPVVLHWDLNHFVVLESVTRRGITIVDPAAGRLKLSYKQASAHFSGVALELFPSPSFVQRAPSPELKLRSLLQHSPGLGRQTLRIVLASLVVQVLLLLGPLYTQWVVDEALMSGDVPLLQVLALGFGLLLIVQVILGYVRDWLVVSIGHVLAQRLASRVADQLFALPMIWFLRRRSGDIFARFRALAPVTGFLTQGLPALFVDSSMMLVASILMLVYDWQLAALVFATTAVYFTLRWVSLPAFKRRTMNQAVTTAQQEAQFLESLGGMNTIKAFGQEAGRLQVWQQRFAQELNAGIRLARFHLSYEALRSVIFGGQLLLVVYLAAHQVLGGTFTLGMLFAFLSYRGHFTTHVASGIEQWINYRALAVSLERLADICMATPEVDAVPVQTTLAQPEVMNDRAVQNEQSDIFRPSVDPTTGLSVRSLSTWRGDLTVRNMPVVTADGGAKLFEIEHLNIAQGECVALVGPSGAGKSSLLQTLMGLRPLGVGELWAGASRVGARVLPQYRRHLGVVQQADHLFAGSLLDNLCLWASPTAPQRVELHLLLERLQLTSCFEQLPMGLDTPLGELGTGFSGGETQRFLLARALLRKPKLLLLDEVTANLDPLSKRAIQDLVLQSGITCVLVTHDLEFAERTNRVISVSSLGLEF